MIIIIIFRLPYRGDQPYFSSSPVSYNKHNVSLKLNQVSCTSWRHTHTNNQARTHTDRFMDPTHPGLATSDGPRTDRAGLLVPAEDLGDATVRNSQLSRDYAGSDAVVGHLHYLVSDVIWQGPPVDEHAAKLVHPTLAQRGGYCATINNKSLKNNKTTTTTTAAAGATAAAAPHSFKMSRLADEANSAWVVVKQRGLFAVLLTSNGTQFTHIIILDIFKRAPCQKCTERLSGWQDASEATSRSNFTFKRH